MSETTADVDLGTFHDYPIVRVDFKLTGTGEGLSKNMAIDPYKFTEGEEVLLLVRATVRHFEYRLVDESVDVDDYEWVEIPVAKASSMTRVEGSDYLAMLDAQAERNEARRTASAEAAKQAEADRLREKERNEGVQHLPGTAEALEDDHLEGNHASGPVKDCPACDWEGVVVDAEAKGGES